MKGMRLGFTALLCLLLFSLSGSISLAGDGAPKQAILIVAFGSSVEKARVAYARVEEQVRAACPGHDIRWAWTAHSLLQSGPDGAPVPSVQEALARLATEGVKDVAVLSLHVIPGAEYNVLAKNAEAFAGLPKGLERIRLCPPLLYDTSSLNEVARILAQSLPKEREKTEAVIYVGHGTHHPAGVYYPALQHYLSRIDKNIFVGTVEGDLELERLLPLLLEQGVKKVWLAPLMTVSGDHALNDLFGDEDNSWKKRLNAANISVEPIMRGLGENPELLARWVAGLKKSMQ
ncbi:sirohydrochlorin cobaltochelatase [Desulfovibrio sp. OttesenSCG-928-A18]|nr:sirohydrochlorin cobaltochelatase [Desulfovibrio sp. OttesenSCG-928-A18]